MPRRLRKHIPSTRLTTLSLPQHRSASLSIARHHCWLPSSCPLDGKRHRTNHGPAVLTGVTKYCYGIASLCATAPRHALATAEPPGADFWDKGA